MSSGVGGGCKAKLKSGFVIVGRGKRFSGAFGVDASGCDASLLPVLYRLLNYGHGLTAFWSLVERVCVKSKSLSRLNHVLRLEFRERRFASDH